MPQHEDRPAEKEQKVREDFRRQRELRIEDGLKQSLSTRHGRQALWWMLEICGVGALPWADTDRQTNFRIGELNVGQQLLNRIIQIDASAYIKMQQENLDDDRALDTRLASARPQSNTDYLGTGEFTQSLTEPEPRA